MAEKTELTKDADPTQNTLDVPLTPEKIVEVVQRSIPILESIPEDLIPTLNRMSESGTCVIDRERLNIILSSWRQPPVDECFFSYYFGERIETVRGLIEGLRHFITDALWHFGDIRRAFAVFCQIGDIGKFIKKHEFDFADFESRLPWGLIEVIPPEDRGFLGYVSGQRPYQHQEVLTITERILKELDENRHEYEGLASAAVQKKLLALVSEGDLKKVAAVEGLEKFEALDLFSLSELNKNREAVERLSAEVSKTILKVKKLKKIGESNQVHYLRNIEMIDVYVATSMRDDRDYIDMAKFVDEVFSSNEIAPLNLRYFDPTLCYCNSRIDKGIIECLLVRTAKVTVYCAQEGDTFGKDSELAATLCQGKPVIVYVPIDNSDLQRAARLESRARVFHEFHPLGMQVGLQDGVARGVIVVRTPEQCSRILRKILSNSLEVDVLFEQHGIVLREKETKCVLRVMTGWGELAHSFWSNFGVSINPKSGLPE